LWFVSGLGPAIAGLVVVATIVAEAVRAARDRTNR
jgi:hypothetical protein